MRYQKRRSPLLVLNPQQQHRHHHHHHNPPSPPTPSSACTTSRHRPSSLLPPTTTSEELTSTGCCPLPFPPVHLFRNKHTGRFVKIRMPSPSPSSSSSSLPDVNSHSSSSSSNRTVCHAGIISPTTGLAYAFLRSINPSPKLKKHIYLCQELERSSSSGGGWRLTQRGQVVLKLAEVDEQDLERIGKVTGPKTERGDDPVEELKAMHYLTTRGGAGDTTCLVPLLDYFCDDAGWLYLVQPFYERQDLFDVIQASPGQRMTTATARVALHCLLVGLQELKALGVGHMDISPENCVMDSLGQCHLADWGMALRAMPCRGGATCNGSSSNSSNSSSPTSRGIACHRHHLVKNQTFRGKSSYAAPEVFDLDDSIDPYACDIFSLGCTLFVMLTGRGFLEPGRDASERPRYRALLRNDFDGLFAGLDDELTISARHLIHGMTHPDVACRLRLEEVMVHPWVLGQCD